MPLFIADEDAWNALPPDDLNEAIRHIGAWYGEQAGKGRIVEGHRLRSVRASTTVTLGPAGRSRRPEVTDGPFMEAKEAVGSYAIIEVADGEEAIELASSWPGGGAIEIRPVME